MRMMIVLASTTKMMSIRILVNDPTREKFEPGWACDKHGILSGKINSV